MDKEPIILITGGAGYIGSHTIVELIGVPGLRIISADNYSNSSQETYARIQSITGHAVEHIDADLSDQLAVQKIFREHPGITGVIHFAAHKSVPESVLRPLDYYRNNINSILNLLEAGKDSLRHFIFSSSCSVYGNISSLPVNEQTAVGHVESPYAFTKVVGEKILEDTLRAVPSMKGIALRYFNPVGAHPSGLLGELPNQRPNNLVPVITQTAIGKIPKMQVFGKDYATRDGTCIRDYVHVVDIARAHVKALELLMNNTTQTVYDVINLGTGNGVTVLEAIHAFEKISGIELNYQFAERRAGDVEAIYSDCTRANQLLKWEALHSLEEMMASAWKWEMNLAKNKV